RLRTETDTGPALPSACVGDVEAALAVAGPTEQGLTLDHFFRKGIFAGSNLTVDHGLGQGEPGHQGRQTQEQTKLFHATSKLKRKLLTLPQGNTQSARIHEKSERIVA